MSDHPEIQKFKKMEEEFVSPSKTSNACADFAGDQSICIFYDSPVYNRSYGHNKFASDGDIALSTHKKKVYLEKEIKSGDTLQSVALEYNVPVSELKRINNIHKDNEIFARKVLKVPSNPLSLLLEKEYFSKVDAEPEEKAGAESESTSYDPIVETVNNCNCVPRSVEENVEEGVVGVSAYTNNNKAIDIEDESVSLLSASVETKTSDGMSCNGADWGISWHVLVLFTVLLGVGGPVLYIFWFIWSESHKAGGGS